MKTILPIPSPRLPGPTRHPATWLALTLSAVLPCLAAENTVATHEAAKPAYVASQTEPTKIDPLKSAALRKEKAATLALLHAERAAQEGGTVAQADLLEARVAARLARQEVRDEQVASEPAAPETEATREQLWADIAAARTPTERREANARYVEFQRLVHERKTATSRTEDKK